MHRVFFPEKKAFYHIGLDDTDSSEGMCTTFLAYKLAKLLRQKYSVRFIDYPNLIRLNPNIPWKTRGNASLVLRFESNVDPLALFSSCSRMVRKFATSEQANSGLVVLQGESVPQEIQLFSKEALHSVLSVKQAKDLIEKYGMLSLSLRSQQGLVGALAGIGNLLDKDHTFELIAYRRNISIKREIDREKVIKMSSTVPRTFGSFDPISGRVLIAPHGPDPVLVGIRGDTPSAVREGFRHILPVGNLLGWIIFRTNQGTGEHLVNFLDSARLKAYTSGKIRGVVSECPEIMEGGHVFFSIKNDGGEIRCACYEPTGDFRLHALNLIPGDEIEVGGGVRKATSKHATVLNLEYFLPLKLEPSKKFRNPSCPRCGVSMSSMGKLQGFRCAKCGKKSSPGHSRQICFKNRLVEKRLYVPQMKAHRHLTKPLQRYGAVSCDTDSEKLKLRRWISPAVAH